MTRDLRAWAAAALAALHNGIAFQSQNGSVHCVVYDRVDGSPDRYFGCVTDDRHATSRGFTVTGDGAVRTATEGSMSCADAGTGVGGRIADGAVALLPSS